MYELQIDDRVPAAERASAPVRDRNLVEPIRTYANSIIGFAEMLEDPELTLSAATRREYMDILRTSGAALELHIRTSLSSSRDAA